MAGSANEGITFSKGDEEGADKGVTFVGSEAAWKEPGMAGNLTLHEIAAYVLGVGHPKGTIKMSDLTADEVGKTLGEGPDLT